MNKDEAIAVWRADPVLRAITQPAGWSVVFVADQEGTYHALDYLEGKGPDADPEFPVTQKHMDRLVGLLAVIRTDGPRALRGNDSFEEFVGDDAGMCELRVVPKQGHRFLCFQRGEREFVVAHAFRKPGQRETPETEKNVAKTVLQQCLTKSRSPVAHHNRKASQKR